MKIKTLENCLIILFICSTTCAQDCSNVFRIYRGYEGIYAEVIKSNAYLENVLRFEITMSVATALPRVINSIVKFIYFNR